MTITQITDYVIFGTTTDQKPLAGVPTQSLFFEVDTGRIYKFTGGVWSIFSGDNKPETLTNKTITLPTISQIKNGAFTLTLPSTSNDTLVARNTTDTLSNKTLNFPIISTISNAGTVTIPTGTRTLVARDTIDTLLTKTINVNSNTITATSQANGDILVNNGTQFVRLARGTNTQVLTSTTTGIQWANATGGGTGGSQSDTYKYTVYVDTGPTYKCRNNLTGTVESSNSLAATVIQYAIDNSTFSGAVFIKSGVYPLGATVNIKSSVLLIGEGRENTLIRPTGNFPAFIFGSTTGIQHSHLEHMLIYHNQSGYTSDLVRFTSDTRFNKIQNCDFWSSGFAAGNAIAFVNTGALNAGVGITRNDISNCFILGFNNGIFFSTANAGTPHNFINDNNFTNVFGMYCIRFVKSSGVAGTDIDHNRFISCSFQSGTSAGGNAPAVGFDYDDAANHNYTVHIGCITWDLPAGIKYANINTNMGAEGMSVVGCTPASDSPSTYIGGSGGSGTTIIKTEGTPLDLAAARTWTGYNQFLLTPAGGYEDVFKVGLNGSADYFALSNNTNASGSFSPIFRANQTSANLDQYTPALFFQAIVKATSDTVDEPAIIFTASRSGNVAVTNKPIAAFRNGLTNQILWIYPTYLDMRGNQIQNAVMGGVRWAVTTKTASYTATDTDVVILCDTTTSAITITLPAASGRSGKFYVIHRKAGTTNSITIDPNASETIDGATTITVPTAAGSSKWIFSDGTSWYSK